MSVSNRNQSIIERNKGLLAIANDHKNDEESQTAFSMAQKLMIKYDISSTEIDIIKSYMQVDANIREGILSRFKDVFARHAETAATMEIDLVEQEVDNFRMELEAEKKGGNIISIRQYKRQYKKRIRERRCTRGE